MILKALNGRKLAQCGYADELEYTNPGFHGHQIGISLGVTDVTTGEIVENYISETQGDEATRKAILKSILKDESVIKIEKPIHQLVDGNLVSRTIWFAPYAVKDHSVFQETLNFNNLVCSDMTMNHVVLEVLFVEQNLNRYITMSYDTKNSSIMDTVYDIFEYTNNIEEWNKDIKYIENGESGTGYYLDFYDEAGEKVMLCFSDMKRLRDAIVSVRLLEVSTTIEED